MQKGSFEFRVPSLSVGLVGFLCLILNCTGPFGLMRRVFASGLGVIPKTQKMVLDAALLNTQHYKVKIKGKVEQSREWSSVLPYPTA